MTPAVAARVWILTQRIIKGVERANEAAANVLKEHFRSSGKPTYLGIGYAQTSYDRLDVKLARDRLGPEGTRACTVPSPRESLTLPTSAKPIVPASLRRLLEDPTPQ